MKFKITPLMKTHNRNDFDCGEESLNEFLKKFARQNDKRGLGKTFVLIEEGKTEVLGYYTLSSGSVTFDEVPENLPRYPIPVAHIGRLAVDKKTKGQGLGELLLVDALQKISKIAEQMGIFAVEVYALNESARKFYLKYGFTELLDDTLHLYLPVKTIQKLNFD
ncbi:MAG: GNAT family N-acetyltransferase [Pyrinomonadaceae bacterium]